MKAKYLLMVLLVIGVIFLIGCTQSQPTQKEYVCSNGQVVLDSSNCPTTAEEKNFKSFDIKVYADDQSGFITLNQMPQTSRSSVTLKCYGADSAIYGAPSEPFCGFLRLYLGTDYREEEISCSISEYYGSVLNGRQTVTLKEWLSFSQGDDTAGQRDAPDYIYEASKKPREVRYDVECKGVESGYEDSTSFYVDISYYN